MSDEAPLEGDSYEIVPAPLVFSVSGFSFARLGFLCGFGGYPTCTTLAYLRDALPVDGGLISAGRNGVDVRRSVEHRKASPSCKPSR